MGNIESVDIHWVLLYFKMLEFFPLAGFFYFSSCIHETINKKLDKAQGSSLKGDCLTSSVIWFLYFVTFLDIYFLKWKFFGLEISILNHFVCFSFFNGVLQLHKIMFRLSTFFFCRDQLPKLTKQTTFSIKESVKFIDFTNIWLW